MTPNMDEKNDNFYLNVLCDHYAFHMDIYNRWGKRLHATDEQIWAGTINGEPAPTGIYYYVAQYSFTGPQASVITHQKKGWISVLK